MTILIEVTEQTAYPVWRGLSDALEREREHLAKATEDLQRALKIGRAHV